MEVLGKVACDLAVICYSLDEENQQDLFSFLISTHSRMKLLWMVPGDDCSGTGFLTKVEEALQDCGSTDDQFVFFPLAAALG